MNAELPQSAIEAALAAHPLYDFRRDPTGYSRWTLNRVLNAAAPHIGAEYLRQAAAKARKEPKPIAVFRHGDGQPDPLITATMLEQWADELEGTDRLGEPGADGIYIAEGTDRLHATNDTDRLHEPAGGEIHIHEGTGTYDPDVPESAFKNPKIDLQPFVTELAQRIGIHNNHLRMGLPDKPSNPWRKWESNDDLEAGVRYETYKDNTGQRWIRDA